MERRTGREERNLEKFHRHNIQYWYKSKHNNKEQQVLIVYCTVLNVSVVYDRR